MDAGKQEKWWQRFRRGGGAAKEKPEPQSWEFLRTMLYAILLAVVFRSFFFEPFHIPSGSMKGTLLIGDYIFVSKFSYGYSRYSFPFGLPLFEGRLPAGHAPERGDIIVFRLPRAPSIDYIKRLVGLPGDRLQVKDGVLYINDEMVRRVRVEDFVEQVDAQRYWRAMQYEETLPNGVKYQVLDATLTGDLDNTGVYAVPEGHYFFMGDNRDNSQDSRVLEWVGFVPEENLVGRAEMVFFSTDGSARWWEIWKWVPSLRKARFFKMLHG